MYAILQGTLTAGGNYTIAYTGALLTILPAPQSITFATLPNMTYGAPDFPVTATASSLLPVSYSGSGSCTVTATGTVHLTNSGLCTVTATQLGSQDYLAAPPVSQSFTVATLYTSDSTLTDFTLRRLLRSAHSRPGLQRPQAPALRFRTLDRHSPTSRKGFAG